jgi:Beta-lactamase enzyme family
VGLERGENRSGWLVRTATVAAIAFSLVMAVAGGVLFGHAVTSPPGTPPERAGLDLPSPREPKGRKETKPAPWPSDDAASDAQRIAAARTGIVSFAVIGPGGKTVKFEPDRQFQSASISKAMLLVAELRRLRREDAPLDEATRTLLEQMITLSDNDAADAIFDRVGDPGLNEVAAISGMTGFEGNAAHWSNVKVTARGLATFMSELDQLLDLPHGEAASKMLRSVTPAQRWGIPPAAPEGAVVRLKGGWRPSEAGQLVLQAARVDDGNQSYSLAVLTDGNPSMAYGVETIRLIAAELLPDS